MSTEIVLSPAPKLIPSAIFAPTPRAARRTLEFFTAQINNDHTRKAYLNATRRFAQWCDEHGIRQLTDVQAFHVAAFVKDLQRDFSAPTVKQHLAVLRMLFDWLVTGHVLEVNPAHAVRGPKYVVKKGKTPVLNADEARALLNSIDTSSVVGSRDRALIGLMIYTFARVNAALEMKVKDYYVQGRRGWVQLHEKGGKGHAVPCHHSLEQFLDEYIAAAGIGSEPDSPLFRTVTCGRGGSLSKTAMWQQDAYRMIQRRAKAEKIKTKIGNHTFRATGITAYMKNGGKLETAQQIDQGLNTMQDLTQPKVLKFDSQHWTPPPTSTVGAVKRSTRYWALSSDANLDHSCCGLFSTDVLDQFGQVVVFGTRTITANETIGFPQPAGSTFAYQAMYNLMGIASEASYDSNSSNGVTRVAPRNVTSQFLFNDFVVTTASQAYQLNPSAFTPLTQSINPDNHATVARSGIADLILSNLVALEKTY